MMINTSSRKPAAVFFIIFLAVIVLCFVCLNSLQAVDRNLDEALPGEHVIKAADLYDRTIQGVEDRGIGLLDKGQLANMVTNYGIISNFHVGTPALHWPREGSDVQHYGFGVDFIVVTEEEVLKSVYDPSSPALDFSWRAMDGGLGALFNDERTEANTAADEVTPFLATSDLRATWPVVDGEPHWPGPYRARIGSPGVEVEGEFTSDRDVYCEFQDNRNIGLRVEQSAFSYARPYAEDILFVRFVLYNESGETMEDVHAGFLADLKPDFYADDRIGAWTIDPYETEPSFIFKQDLNGIPQRDDSSYFEDVWNGPLGWIGMGLVRSPGDAGVTSFHYFHDDLTPVEDSQFRAIMTNTPDSMENSEDYFHGENLAFDDPLFYMETDRDTLPGSEITFLLSSGGFTIPAGDSAEIAIVFALGVDSLDLRSNVETAYQMAYEAEFQGSGPPSTPHLTAFAGDGYVQLTWDNSAEFSIDALSGQQDFQGYRLYRSEDRGETWGQVLTNWFGDAVGYVPLFQCDLMDSITGLDPAFGPDFPNAYAWLGDDSGLQHSYVDYDVTNGLEVWYTVCSYDRGVFTPAFPDSIEPSYESPRGISTSEQSTVSVIPGVRASDMTEGIAGNIMEINGLQADGILRIDVVDPSALTGDNYRITFDWMADTLSEEEEETGEITFSLYNITRQSYQFVDNLTGDLVVYQNMPLGFEDLPVVDGFRPYIESLGVGIRSTGWTTIAGDSCTFDWWTENREPGNSSSYDEVVEGLDDWRITVTETTTPVRVVAAGFGEDPLDTLELPIRVERSIYEQGGTWEDVTDHLLLSDLWLAIPNPSAVGPYGWDLEPGGLGYNPNERGYNIWMDILFLRDDENDSTGSLIWLKTENGPETAIPPSIGDVYTITTYKPFSEAFTYEFSTHPPTGIEGSSLGTIRAVPNPFIVRSGFETDPLQSRIMFTNLPSQCTIDIYTVAGRKVRTLHHDSTGNEGFTYWDVRNENGQDVAYGLYVYVVKAPGGQQYTDKIMVIR